MIWDVALWIATAVLVVVIVLRVAGKRAPKANKSQVKDKQQKRSGNIFTQGKVLPTAAAAILALALIMKFDPGLLSFGPNWSDEEMVEVESFREALNQYELATLTKDEGRMSDGDWETIKALLEASGSEMSLVSNDVLSEIHQELPTHVTEEFLPGIRLGTYGLSQYLSLRGRIRDEFAGTPHSDSMNQGRELLGKWNEWFQANQDEITSRIE